VLRRVLVLVRVLVLLCWCCAGAGAGAFVAVAIVAVACVVLIVAATRPCVHAGVGISEGRPTKLFKRMDQVCDFPLPNSFSEH